MLTRIKRTIGKSRPLHILAEWAYNFATIEIPWVVEKHLVLGDAKRSFPHELSLDVTKLYGAYIFHNKGNTLAKLGHIYEPEVQKALLTLIGLDKLRNKESVFADVGANIGLHTFFLKNRYPDLPIIAFDPSPSSWKYLEFSLRYNGTPGVRVEKFALSNIAGVLKFYNWGEESSADSLQDTHRVKGQHPIVIEVQGMKLDDFPESSKISVIKLDCEGAESLILRGARNTIRNNMPFIILEFYHKNFDAFQVTPEDIFILLDDLEYNILTTDLEKIDLVRFKQLQTMDIENYILLPRALFA
jgi:FkbM family methyltransferase